MQKTQIIDYLSAHGYALRRQGRTWASSQCPKCGPSGGQSNKLCLFEGRDGRWRFYCHACQVRGDYPDLIALVEGLPEREALRRAGERAMVPAPQVQAERPAPDLSLIEGVVARWLDRLPRTSQDVEAYLASRGISAHVVREAAERGLVRFLPTDPVLARRLLIEAAGGVDPMRAAGLWAGQSERWPANAFRPLLFFYGRTTVEFIGPHQGGPHQGPKAIRVGRLTKPMAWRGGTSVARVCEGGIDLLSLAQGGGGKTILAIPGVSAWRLEWFKAAHAAYGTRFEIALDADEAGERAAQKILSLLAGEGIEAVRVRPPKGAKDWNEALLCSSV